MIFRVGPLISMVAEGGSGSVEEKEPELEPEVTYYWLEEGAKRNSEKDVGMVIHGRVYDITRFLGEHPGGEEVLIEQAGRDATESFEDVGYSADAKEMLKLYYVGDFHLSDCKGEGSENSSSFYKSCWSNWIIPVVGVVLLAVIYRFYMAESKLSSAILFGI